MIIFLSSLPIYLTSATQSLQVASTVLSAFTYMISVLMTPCEVDIIIILISQRGSLSAETLSNLLKTTQLVTGKGGTRSWVSHLNLGPSSALDSQVLALKLTTLMNYFKKTLDEIPLCATHRTQ